VIDAETTIIDIVASKMKTPWRFVSIAGLASGRLSAAAG
jgi:hypothetical protein